MGDVVCLKSYLEKKNAPDANQVYVDDDGVQWFVYGIDYTDQRGRTMSLSLWATSFDDAQKRLALVKDNGRIYGQIISEIE